jgi:hypothetical protein
MNRLVHPLVVAALLLPGCKGGRTGEGGRAAPTAAPALLVGAPGGAPEPVPALPAGCEMALSVNLEAMAGVDGLKDLVPAILDSFAGDLTRALSQQGIDPRRNFRRVTLCKSGSAARAEQVVFLLSGPFPDDLLRRLPWLQTAAGQIEGLPAWHRGGVWLGQHSHQVVAASKQELLRAALLGPHATYPLQGDPLLSMEASGVVLRQIVGGDRAVQLPEMNSIHTMLVNVSRDGGTLELQALVADSATAGKLAARLGEVLAAVRGRPRRSGFPFPALTAQAQGSTVMVRGPLPPAWLTAVGRQLVGQVGRSYQQREALRRAAALSSAGAPRAR